ncbi:unnamed protein product [Dibothriocephalus latus]|uniref:Prolyl 4-hydroxylase peptide-substrate-binding domain-containing protein n=1 Tax=Dibothriocephalus latus TaxID=60516 RepID=A0A3P7LI69_DIBLA|nr:unnamed protein product [Dibothriocephalus latus]
MKIKTPMEWSKKLDHSKGDHPKILDYQCFILGKYAYDHGQYARAEEWFRLVLKRIETGNNIRGSPQTDEIYPLPLEGILDYLQYSIGRRGHYREALEFTKRLLKENPNNENALKSLRFYESELVRLHGGEPMPPEEQLKEEIMQVEPPIVLWHDFVTAGEVEHIQDIARPRVSRFGW